MDIQPDEKKFKEFVLYVADRLGAIERGGATMLNKVLYFSEFIHLRRYGRPITGVEYQKLPNGPAPRRLLPLRDDLIREKAVAIKKEHVFEYEQHRLVALREADLEAFAGSEIAVVDEVIERFRGLSAEEISELSHAEPAWEQLEIGETIPYDTAYLAPPILTPGIREHALGLLERIRA